MDSGAKSSALWRGLFPGDVVVVAGDPHDVSEALWPDEEPLVARAVDKRRREFAKGRECARRGLAAVGIAPCAIVQGTNREPVWPASVVGSITHTKGLCAAVVGRSETYRALGVDLEPDKGIEPALWDRILSESELASVRALAEAERGGRVRLLFSAKECFYKCQHTVSQTFLGFHDAEVRIDATTFDVELRKDTPPFPRGTRMHGAWRRADGFVATAMWLEVEKQP